MFENIMYTRQDIVDKDFPVVTRGYSPQEVDKFLDSIIKDETEYINIANRLRKDNKYLEEENSRLKSEIRRLKELNSASNDLENSRTTNLDILKRLSSLEKTVYGKDI